MEISQILDKTWDYIIVGTGVGGSLFGLKLAEAGASVLFLEKGESMTDSDSLKGQFAEQFPGNDRKQIFKKAGRLTTEFKDCTETTAKIFTSFLGSGVGGSSALYGMALQRFKEIDFEKWPLKYSDYQKYYEEAEKIFKVRKPNVFKNPDLEKLGQKLNSQGLHPYNLPIANDDVRDCKQCQSFLCDRVCKNETGKVAIQPAIENFKAELLTNCEVLKIETENDFATAVKVKLNQKITMLKAKNIVLGAGALFTPLILLNSKNQVHPKGLGNNFDLVGRYLMRHYVDLYALKIDEHPENHFSKELAFDDYYFLDGQKLGTVQSFGRLPPMEIIISDLTKQIPFLKITKPLLKRVLGFILKNRLVMASIIEDSPEKNNRVWLEGEQVCLSYRISKSDQEKISLIRSRLNSLFKPFNSLLIKSAEKNEMLAHACGTCRMGNEPSASVVNLENRVHGFKNLYIVDSSIFPTSGGTNPALTIGANALRVADLVLQRNTNRQHDRNLKI